MFKCVIVPLTSNQFSLAVVQLSFMRLNSLLYVYNTSYILTGNVYLKYQPTLVTTLLS